MASESACLPDYFPDTNPVPLTEGTQVGNAVAKRSQKTTVVFWVVWPFTGTPFFLTLFSIRSWYDFIWPDFPQPTSNQHLGNSPTWVSIWISLKKKISYVVVPGSLWFGVFCLEEGCVVHAQVGDQRVFRAHRRKVLWMGWTRDTRSPKI